MFNRTYTQPQASTKAPGNQTHTHTSPRPGMLALDITAGTEANLTF